MTKSYISIHMQKIISRRQFIQYSGAASTGLAAISPFSIIPARAQGKSSNRVRVGVMGLSRGMAHVNNAVALPNVEVAYVCDVDQQRIDRAIDVVDKKNAPKPQGVRDFRRMLDDKDLDAIMIATCNHWHAPASILACSAGKHVYVEKPGSHNPQEGFWMVQAARKHKRVVQMGNQRRTWPAIREAMARLHSGVIGETTFARCWYDNARSSIGSGKKAPVPPHLDFDLWQGPAPRRDYKDNLVHYNWHWHWHWGNGELGNNGIHALDLARWGLDVDYPETVSYTGGRYHYDDDQETPDTAIAVYDFGEKGASWDGSSCHPRREKKHDFVRFYGSKGSLAINGTGYEVFDLDGQSLEKHNGEGGDRGHVDNFFTAIRSGKRPNSEIATGQISTLMCHLGNIAYRTGQTLHFDRKTLQIKQKLKENQLWERDYETGWKPVI
jgi:predicted dehydrogenase